MSDSIESNKRIPTNEEVIEEITRGLNDQHVDSSNEFSKTKEHHADPLTDNADTSPIPADFDRSSDDETNQEQDKDKIDNPFDDHIDEEELKAQDESLTDQEKEEKKSEAAELKTKGNACHKKGDYLDAVDSYTRALRLCPLSCSEERAVLYSNRAASKIQLNYKKAALDDCSKAIELNPNYVRAYLRRAKLYEELEKLDESLEDYKKVIEFDPGNPEARKASVRLPPLITERNEKLKTEVLGKLKDLGNLVLKPFGLSTENFQLQQDPNSGGYSINFKQNQ